jgi:hypothetical protein
MRLLLIVALCAPTLAFAEEVTIQNLVRAESDHMFRATLAGYGIGVGELVHERAPVSAEGPQPIIRANQDTLYSALILDLSEPATVTLPETDGRFQSMLVISQDHYAFVEAAPGTNELTEEGVGTRFAFVLFRTIVDAADPDDLAAAYEAQDGITLTGGGDGPFEAPDWDLENLGEARKAVNDLASAIGFDASRAFGRKDEVDPIDHLVGAIAGWAGQPATTASAVIDSVDANDGETPHAVTVRDVPVDAFWSITVYNADGYLKPNELGRNSHNNVSATPNDDGSFTIHFGACDDGRVNCIPITPGWNYTIRLNEPRPEILDGSWSFPNIEPAGQATGPAEREKTPCETREFWPPSASRPCQALPRPSSSRPRSRSRACIRGQPIRPMPSGAFPTGCSGATRTCTPRSRWMRDCSGRGWGSTMPTASPVARRSPRRPASLRSSAARSTGW